LSILSDAKPKIANYHFTTLKPNLGVVRVDTEKSFVIADIPGLIEGAHKGAGLGLDFLRHVERTRVLVHVLDASGQEGRNPVEDFYKINEELFQYNEKLKEKKQIIVPNKMDLPESKEWLVKIKKEFEPKGYEIYPISAATGEGIEKLKYVMWEMINKVESNYETFDEEMDIEAEEPKEEPIVVKKEDGRFIVEGSFIERLLYSINFSDLESVRYFQNVMRQKGIVDKLLELGIKEGESVFICGYEFEFFE